MLALRAIAPCARQLRTGVLPLRVRLVDIRRGRYALVIAVPSQIVRAVVHLDGVLEEGDSRVIAAQVEVVGGQLRLQGKCDRGGVCLAALRLRTRRVGGVAQSAEQVDL